MKYKIPVKFNFYNRKINLSPFCAKYFKKAEFLVQKYAKHQIATMQFTFFGNLPVKVCGIYESVQLIKSSLNREILKKIKIYGLRDGDIAFPGHPVLLIKGYYPLFAICENIIDGILTRRTSVCNNCFSLTKILNESRIIYMADRSSDFFLQSFDGYSAYIGGIKNFVTEAQVKFIKNKKNIGVGGTIPHALIQQFNGDLPKAMRFYNKSYGSNKSVALIDYHNDVEREIKLLSHSKIKIFAVRIDTASNLVDFGLQRKFKDWKKRKDLYGVNYELIKLVRRTLDSNGYKNVKIIISGNMDKNKIESLLMKNSEFDIVGVGEFFIKNSVRFTADLVMNGNEHEAKFGRKLVINSLNKLVWYI